MFIMPNHAPFNNKKMPNEKANSTRPVLKIYQFARIHPDHNKLSITYGHKSIHKHPS